jgi:hypothetical protein
MCIWLCKGYVGHRKIWWGYGCTTPPCLHWYTTLVIWRRRNSSKWWHIILLRTSFLGRGRTFSYNPSSFIFFIAGTRSPSSNQSSFPSRKSLHLPSGRSKFTFATLKPPLSSSLICFSFYIYSNPSEVLGGRCFGFLVIPSLKEIANMER